MRPYFPYGLDAPPVVRALGIGAALCWVGSLLGPMGFFHVRIYGLIWPALSLTLGAVLMVWNSRIGKVRAREKLLDRLSWRGDETVLDVGCGYGLLAVAAARRVPRGLAIGLDIWRQADLSSNHPDHPRRNAMHEGVADRVLISTADMRLMPFADACFDIVVSSVAIHNVPDAAGRLAALEEIVRVLKPSGAILIDDIRHDRDYAAFFKSRHCHVRTERGMSFWFWRVFSFTAMSPAVTLARKEVA
ncbi:class I SAM-dependent methyltransferase [Kozakia baliensis]|uniref:class I SAM-dependent methyltransferase n=1 Tax=Kozakia baliensis TaxID=153496 RepID=UPI00345C421C